MDYRIVYVGAQSVFAILFLVFFGLQRMNRKGQRLDSLERLYLVFFVTAVLDGLWILIDSVPEYRLWHILLQMVYLSAMTMTGYLWLSYTIEFFPAKSLTIRKYKHLLTIPVLIEIILIITSAWTNKMFIVDASGQYIRGPWHIYEISINYIYMVMGSVVALKCGREAHLTIDKRRYYAAAFFPVPVLIFSGVQMLLPPGLPAMQGGVLVAMLLLYGMSQNILITRDHLTDLPNRFSFEHDLVSFMNRRDQHQVMHTYLIAGDLDKFKYINDNYGHPTGDDALVITAEALREVFARFDATVYRTGGDEFMVLISGLDVLDIDSIRNELNEKLAALSSREMPARARGNIVLSMSLGMVEYDGSQSFQAIIESADKELYEAKA